MRGFSNLWTILFHPRKTTRELLKHGEYVKHLWIVLLLFAAVISVLFLVSHLKQDYPPSPNVLEVWIDTWGEFAMLPVVPIPAEYYRLAQAIFVTPLIFSVWVLMAGSARLLSRIFNGSLSFRQYMVLLGFSFFPFWMLGHVLDIAYSAVLGDRLVPALLGEYGSALRSFVTAFPAVMWTALLCLGGIYNGIAAHEGEGSVWWKAAVTGCVTCAWPIVLISFLIR